MTIIINTKDVENKFSIFINKIPFEGNSNATTYFVAVLQSKTNGEIEWFKENTFQSCLTDIKNYLVLRDEEIVNVENIINIYEEMEVFRDQVNILIENRII